MRSQGEFVLDLPGDYPQARPEWAWVHRYNRHGIPMVEGRSAELECMIHFSTYRPQWTSTTFWPPGKRWTGDHFLKGERTRSLEEAMSFVEAHSVDELLRRSKPRLAQVRESVGRAPIKRSNASMPSCAICGAGNAYFGFGPPLVAELVWVCAKHRRDVDPALA